MTPLTAAQIRSLLTPPATPCVSIYLPTHRGEPLRREDPIRYKDLVRQAEAELRTKYPAGPVNDLVRRFDDVADDGDVWMTAQDGLAVLGAGNDLHVFRLPRTVPERVAVADSYHLKPLLRVAQSADRFHVLGITRTEVFLFEGDRYGLTRVPTRGVLPTFDEAVGTDLTQADRQQISRGGRDASTGHYSGHGSRKDELGRDTERWLRETDRAMLENVSKPSGLPVVLAGLPENTSEFRKLSHNQNLVADDVAGDPGAFTLEGLRAAAWTVFEPRYLERLHKLTEGFGTAKARGTGSADPAEIGAALAQRRVGLLLADADKVVPGKIDPATGAVRSADLGDPDVDDLIDDLAELTLKTGGEVVVVPSERMPSDTGVAAVYRY